MRLFHRNGHKIDANTYIGLTFEGKSAAMGNEAIDNEVLNALQYLSPRSVKGLANELKWSVSDVISGVHSIPKQYIMVLEAR